MEQQSTILELRTYLKPDSTLPHLINVCDIVGGRGY